MKTKYTKELLEPLVSTSESVAQVLSKLGLRPSGGNYAHIKRVIGSYQINTEHFLGQAIHKGRRASTRRSPEEYLVLYDKSLPQPNTYDIKNRLVKDGIKEHECGMCKNKVWNGEPIPLELHHKNGDRWDNRFDNIELLCPNCHAQTENYRGKKNTTKLL